MKLYLISIGVGIFLVFGYFFVFRPQESAPAKTTQPVSVFPSQATKECNGVKTTEAIEKVEHLEEVQAYIQQHPEAVVVPHPLDTAARAKSNGFWTIEVRNGVSMKAGLTYQIGFCTGYITKV